MNKIGYVLIEHYQINKPKVCEAPRHTNFGLPAYAVMAIDYEWDGVRQTHVLLICKDCWNHFDQEMNSPNWNLME